MSFLIILGPYGPRADEFRTMSDPILSTLLSPNRRLESDLPPESIADETGCLLVTCSMASHSTEGLWPIPANASVFSVGLLGNQVRTPNEAGKALDSNLAYLLASRPIETIAVVGHTGCGVIETAYDEWVAPAESPADDPAPRLEPLVELVGGALESSAVDADLPRRALLARLAEYNVARQVEYLTADDRTTATVVGYVYDADGAYGGFPDTAYLVSINGQRDPDRLRLRVPAGENVAVDSLTM